MSSDAFNAADPVAALSALLVANVRAAGYEDVQPAEGVLEGDDGIFEMPLSLAFAPNGLLPLVTESAKLVYADGWLDRTGYAWPFEVEPARDGLLGVRVRFVPGRAPFGVALLCALDALHGFMARNPVPKPLLVLG